jgi:hypothetical protein
LASPQVRGTHNALIWLAIAGESFPQARSRHLIRRQPVAD